MPWCPKCKLKYRSGFDICNDCKVKLVDDLQEVSDDLEDKDIHKGDYFDDYKNLEEDFSEELNEFEEEVQSLQEWQKHQYDPGYYIGTGRIPKPVAALSHFPSLLIGFGIILTGYSILNVALNNISLNLILANVIPLLLGIVLVIGGVQRIMLNHKNKEETE
jgi:hypothetical protein